MVGAAEKHKILEGRLAAIRPMHEMVSVSPGRRAVAAREPTAAIADHQGATNCSGHRPGRPADRQRHALLVHLDGGAHSVTTNPADRLVRDGTSPIHLGGRGTLFAAKRGRRNGHGEMRPLTSRRRQ